MSRFGFGMFDQLPRLILLPGLDGTGLLFEPLLCELSPGISFTVMRYPGDKSLGYDELLSFVRDQLPRGESYVLLGESFSGPLAVRLAAEAPPGLCGLILVATFVTKPMSWLPRWFGMMIHSLAFRLFPIWAQLRVLTSGRSTPELRELYRSALSQVQPRVLKHRVVEVFRVDVSREFQQITVPILAIAGRFDRTVPGHNLRRLQHLRSDLRVEMITSDHLVLQVQPRRAAEVIRRFMDAVA